MSILDYLGRSSPVPLWRSFKTRLEGGRTVAAWSEKGHIVGFTAGECRWVAPEFERHETDFLGSLVKSTASQMSLFLLSETCVGTPSNRTVWYYVCVGLNH